MKDLLISDFKKKPIINPFVFVGMTDSGKLKLLQNLNIQVSKVSKRHILQQFNDFFQFDITKRSRKKHFLFARMLFVYLFAIVNKEGFASIGRLIGMDHSSIIHTKNAINDAFFTKHYKEKFFQDILFVILTRKTNYWSYYHELIDKYGDIDNEYFQFIEIMVENIRQEDTE